MMNSPDRVCKNKTNKLKCGICGLKIADIQGFIYYSMKKRKNSHSLIYSFFVV